MQRHRRRPSHTSPLASLSARFGSLSRGALLFTLMAACSSRAPGLHSSGGSNESVHTDGAESKLVVGYLPNYRGALSEWTRALDFSALTHVNLAFANFDPGADGVEIHYRTETGSGDEPGLADFVKRAHDDEVKVCLSVGGWAKRDELAAAILSAPNELAEKLANYAQEHDLDCIDSDLEKGEPSSELVRAYGTFIRDLGSRLHGANKQLTAAVGMWIPDTILPNIEQFDFLNVMAYDYNGADGSQVPVQTSSYTDAQKELEWWVNHGAAPTQLVLGVPFYGFKWNGGTGNAIPYRQIVDDLRSVPTSDEVKIDASTITLNSPRTISDKAELAKASYGGIMAWELWQDAQDERSLLQVIKKVMR